MTRSDGPRALPDRLSSDVHRDLVRGHRNVWGRRAALSLLVVVLALGLLNVFGQQPRTSVGRAPAVVVRVTAPVTVRGGLFYEGRIEVEAQQRIAALVILLDSGWLDDTSINTVTPEPAEQRSDDGRLQLGYGPVAAGERLVLRLQLQVNPGFRLERPQGVEVRDGSTTLVRVDRHLRTYP